MGSRRKDKAMKGWSLSGTLGGVLRLVNVVFVLLLLTSYVAPYVSPQTFWLLAFFGLMYPVFLIVNMAFLVFWTFRRRPFALYSFVAILLGWNLLWSHFRFTGKVDDLTNPRTIKVLTYNVKHLSGLDDQKRVDQLEAIAELIGNTQADVVFMQEFFSKKKTFDQKIEFLKEKIGLKYYTYRTYFPTRKKDGGYYCILTLSRFPIVSHSDVSLQRRRVALITDIAVPGDTFRLVNVHFRSNHLNSKELSLINPEQEGFPDQERLKKDSRNIYWKLRRAFIDRSRHADLVKRALDKSPHPVIVAGDFNDTPASYTVHTLLGGMNDAFEYAGEGYGNTFAGNLPPIRIDYLACDDYFEVGSYYVIKRKFSDHYPVVATFTPLNDPR